MGNINLESAKGKITALSSAITKQDKQIVNFLIENVINFKRPKMKFHFRKVI
jgi:hypothetical protein